MLDFADDCSDLFRSGITAPGIYPLDLSPEAATKEVYCDGGWTAILTRDRGFGNDNNHFSARDLVDYVAGFGAADDEFFIGLDTLAR